MKYTIDKQEKYAIFELGEENLNSMIAPSLKSEFVILINEGISNLILDLSDVKYVDSSGLSAILAANRLWSVNGTFILTGAVHPSVVKLISITRLETVVNILPSKEDGIQFLQLEELENELRAEAESDDEVDTNTEGAQEE